MRPTIELAIRRALEPLDYFDEAQDALRDLDIRGDVSDATAERLRTASNKASTSESILLDLVGCLLGYSGNSVAMAHPARALQTLGDRFGHAYAGALAAVWELPLAGENGR